MVVVYITCGKTATGKTSIAQYLASTLKIPIISQSKLKRELLDGYTSYTHRDSLNEELRNLGYQKAIRECEGYLREGKSVIIDASFHKRLRRGWLTKALEKYGAVLVALFMKCENMAEIERRIHSRRTEIKNHNNQADSMEVYHHISQGFEDPSIAEFLPIRCAILEIDTHHNVLGDINTSNIGEMDILNQLKQSVNRYLARKRNEEQ